MIPLKLTQKQAKLINGFEIRIEERGSRRDTGIGDFCDAGNVLHIDLGTIPWICSLYENSLS